MPTLYPSDIGDFVIGSSPIGGYAAGIPYSTLQKVIASYLYVEYQDDDSLQAFVSSFNSMAQDYLDTFNRLNLPVYTQGNIAGSLLDWVANGIYGKIRPGLPTFGKAAQGTFNSYQYNTLKYNQYIPSVGQTFYETSDDTFKRVITWLFYKGDGKIFNINWLKRRIVRFLKGINGSDADTGTTYSVSVTFTGSYAATISIPNNSEGVIFKAAVLGGAIELPFQYTWTVTLV